MTMVSHPQSDSRAGASATVTAAKESGANRKRSLHGRRWMLGLVGAVGLIIIIEFVSRIGIVDEQFLPPFSSVVVVLAGLVGDVGFLTDVGSTLLTWFLGLLLSAVVAVPAGLLLGLSPTAYRLARTPMELVRTLPAVALIPLVIIMVGNGLEMKLIIAVYAGLWPIMFNTIYGARGTDPKAKEMGKSFRISAATIIGRVVLPSAAPFVATGIRVSSSIVLIVAITVELLAGGASGIGAFISSMRVQGNRVEEVYAAIVVAGLMGLVINAALGALERRFFRWDTTTRSGV